MKFDFRKKLNQLTTGVLDRFKESAEEKKRQERMKEFIKKRTRDMMSKEGLVETGVMGAKNYTTAFNTVFKKVKRGDITGASAYIAEQSKKIKEQQEAAE